MGHKPLTRDDYMNARWISEPLCLFDNCLETDGALAVVVTSAERARDLPHPPALIHSFAQGLPPKHQTMTNYFTDDPLRGPAWTAARRLWANADVTPADVQVAQLYDAFSPLIPLSLEGYGFCERGEGGPFTDNGNIEWPDGRLPGEHRRAAACRRRTCTASTSSSKACARSAARSTSQVEGAEVSLVTSGEGVPTSAILFTKDALMETAWLLPDLDEPTSAEFWDGLRARRAARADVRVVRAAAHAAPADVPALPVDRRALGSRRRAAVAIWSFIVPHPPLLPAFAEVAPYNAIIVELEEDPLIRFAGNLVTSADGEINEIDPATIEIGEPVQRRVPPDRRRAACRGGSARSVGRSVERDELAGDLAALERLEAVVDLLERHDAADQLVELELPGQVPLDVLRHVDAEPVRSHVGTLDALLQEELEPVDLDAARRAGSCRSPWRCRPCPAC